MVVLKSSVTSETRRLIVPYWHLVSFVVLLFTILGLLYRVQISPGFGNSLAYLLTITAEWVLFGFVVFGIKIDSLVTLRQLIGGRWTNAKEFVIDLVVAFLFWVVWTAVSTLLVALAGPTPTDTLTFLHPVGSLEITLWVAMALSAGFCEEVIFRGYLQKQLLALVGNSWIAVLGQALVFGFSHFYQGFRKVMIIVVLGLLFGSLAQFRKSLRPGILSHCWSDTLNVIPIHLR